MLLQLLTNPPNVWSVQSTYSRLAVPRRRAVFAQPAHPQAKQEPPGGKPSRHNLTTIALLRLYWPMLLLHSFWVLVEIGIR